MHKVLAGPELTHAAVLRLPAHCRAGYPLHNCPERSSLFANRYTVTKLAAGKETDGYTL
jgi:hypothetical protein